MIIKFKKKKKKKKILQFPGSCVYLRILVDLQPSGMINKLTLYVVKWPKSNNNNELVFLLSYLHFVPFSVIRNKVLFCHIDFSYRDGEGADCCCKLPKDCAHVFENAEEGNLDDANFTRLLNQVTRNSKREYQSIDAVQVISDHKNSVICYGSRHNDRGYSQRQYHQVYYETDKIQPVPQVPEKSFSF